jgi:hypothetical protein
MFTFVLICLICHLEEHAHIPLPLVNISRHPLRTKLCEIYGLVSHLTHPSFKFQAPLLLRILATSVPNPSRGRTGTSVVGRCCLQAGVHGQPPGTIVSDWSARHYSVPGWLVNLFPPAAAPPGHDASGYRTQERGLRSSDRRVPSCRCHPQVSVLWTSRQVASVQLRLFRMECQTVQ